MVTELVSVNGSETGCDGPGRAKLCHEFQQENRLNGLARSGLEMELLE